MRIHRVQAGDTLGKISRRYYGNASRYPLIVIANGLTDPNRLKIGQDLVIPDVALPTPALPGSVPPPLPAAGWVTRTAQLNTERLALVHPAVAIRIRSLLDLAGHDGLALLVTQGYRTWEEQNQLYAKGRTTAPIGKAHIVTYARGGQSYHNFGLAVDLVVLDAMGKADWDDKHPGWARAGALGKTMGLEWGGTWKKLKDLPHFQYTGGVTLANCRALYANNGLPSVWEQVT